MVLKLKHVIYRVSSSHENGFGQKQSLTLTALVKTKKIIIYF